MAQRVKAIMIIEIAGRPPEHVKESLKAHIGQIRNLKNVKLLSESYSDPKKVEEAQEIYTCFAEIEVETMGFLDMMNLVFDFMPSSFEIIEPGNIELSLTDATAALNTLSGRLHRYDEIAKVAQFQVQQLAQRLQAAQKPIEEMKEVKGEKKSGKKTKKAKKK